MNDPFTLALVFVGGAGGSAIRWLRNLRGQALLSRQS